MYGLRFKINNAYDTYLEKIFHQINISQYCWQILQDDVFDENNQFLFNQTFYQGSAFKEVLQNKKYYIISLKMIASKTNTSQDVQNYTNFKKSKACFMIKIIDNIFVDIFSKDKSIINIIESNLVKLNIKNIEHMNSNNIEEYYDND